jgi:hypothetical protein
MNLVIEHLRKELERQNLLIASREANKEIDIAYPNLEKFRDQLQGAIGVLKQSMKNKN